MNKRFSRGFTLIEILVVVSIFGLISSVALANLQTARQKAEVAAGQQFHATVERSLGVDEIGKWEFDEGLGTTAVDGSGNGRDGSVVGATYINDGISGSALLLDGNDYITGVGFPNPGENADLTITAWVRPTNVATNNTLFQAGGSSCTTVSVGVTGGKVYSASSPTAYPIAPTDDEGNPTGGAAISSERNAVNNVWQNTTFVYSGNTLDTYINGVKKSTVTAGTADCSDEEWTVGASLTPSSFGYGFNGAIDSVRVFGAALTASEVQNIYAMEADAYRNPVVMK